MIQMKTHIAKHQLVWILTDCFGEKEIVSLVNQCGILHDNKRKSTIPKDWFANDLATCFLRETSIEKTVSQYLAQKAEQATRRIRYMSVEEIKVFLRSTEQLSEDGEFGEIVWALLVDSREDVQEHGHKLLADHEQSINKNAKSAQNDNRPIKTETGQPGDKVINNQSPIANPNISPSVFALVDGSPRSESPNSEQLCRLHEERQKSEHRIEKLVGTISTLKNEHTLLQNKNAELNQKIQLLTDENRILRDKGHAYRESESRIHRLECENKNLRQELEKFSNQLCEFHGFQLEKEKIATELKAVEEVAYSAQQTLERMQSDFHSQFAYLQRVSEEYRSTLTSARKKITTSDDQRGSGNGNHLLAGQPRVGVFVDVQNMFYAAKDRYARRLDYIKLLDLIVGPRNLVIAYAYVVQIPEINQSGFLSLLEHNGYTIKSKDLRMRGDGSAKGDWDVGIAIDVMSMLDALDIVILASGDGDFCALAEIIKRHGKRIEVVAFEHNTSMDLQRVADQFFPIGDDMLI